MLGGAIALYLLATATQLVRWQNCTQNTRYAIRALSALALVLHGWIALKMISTQMSGIDLSFLAAAVLFTWMFVLLIWLISLWQPLIHLFILALPACIFTLALLFIYPELAQAEITFSGGLLWLHALPALVAYVMLSTCFCQAVLLFLQEKQLHNQTPFQFTRALPPLIRMENMLFQLLKISTALLSLVMLSGFIFLQDMFAQRVVHHSLLSIAAWLAMIALLWGHNTYGWRGRVAAQWVMAGFVLLLLAYFGAKLVIEIIIGEVG